MSLAHPLKTFGDQRGQEGLPLSNFTTNNSSTSNTGKSSSSNNNNNKTSHNSNCSSHQSSSHHSSCSSSSSCSSCSCSSSDLRGAPPRSSTSELINSQASACQPPAELALELEIEYRVIEDEAGSPPMAYRTRGPGSYEMYSFSDELLSPEDREPRGLHIPANAFRRQVWSFLNGGVGSQGALQQAAGVYQAVTAALIVVLFLFDSKHLGPRIQRAFNVVECCSFLCFTLDYLLRIYTSVEGPPMSPLPNFLQRSLGPVQAARLRTMLSLSMIMDLLSTASLGLDLLLSSRSDQLRVLLWLRFVRLLNLIRVERHFRFLRPVVHAVWYKRQELGATCGIAGLVLLMASATMYYIESPTNEQFSNMFMSMWWATSTLTTVGYGDIVPITPLGRCLGSIIAFLGVGLFVLPAGIITSGFQENFSSSASKTSSTSASDSAYSGGGEGGGNGSSGRRNFGIIGGFGAGGNSSKGVRSMDGVEDGVPRDSVEALRQEMGELRDEVRQMRETQARMLMLLQDIHQRSSHSDGI